MSEQLPLGAHLVSPRRGYTHHGIYAGGGLVIHYAGFSRGWRRGPVEEVPLERFSCGRPVAVEDDTNACFPGPVRVDRARLRLGEDRFSLWTNNCEHFCAWCLCGTSLSAQVEALRALLRRILVEWVRPGRGRHFGGAGRRRRACATGGPGADR